MKRPRCKKCNRAGKRALVRKGSQGKTWISTSYFICPVCGDVINPSGGKSD